MPPQLEKILKALLSNIKILLGLLLLVGYLGVMVYDKGPKDSSAVVSSTTTSAPRITSTTLATTTTIADTTTSTTLASTTTTTTTLRTTPTPSPSPSPSPVNNGINKAPAVSNITIFQPNYCEAAASATITWGYSDPDKDPQSAYQVQIDDMSGNWQIVDIKNNNGGLSYFTSLFFGKTYKARVRAWDNKGNVSEWKESESWSAPKHPYPQVDFGWTPVIPFIDQAVQFTDRTTYSDGGSTGQRRWSWDFGDGESAEIQNPTHYYGGFGTFGIVATVTDKDGYSCSSLNAKEITVRRK